jgi:hypothetical protein
VATANGATDNRRRHGVATDEEGFDQAIHPFTQRPLRCSKFTGSDQTVFKYVACGGLMTTSLLQSGLARVTFRFDTSSNILPNLAIAELRID